MAGDQVFKHVMFHSQTSALSVQSPSQFSQKPMVSCGRFLVAGLREDLPFSGQAHSPDQLPLHVAGIKFDPSGSRVVRKDGVIVSNSLAAFAYIRGR